MSKEKFNDFMVEQLEEQGFYNIDKKAGYAEHTTLFSGVYVNLKDSKQNISFDIFPLISGTIEDMENYINDLYESKRKYTIIKNALKQQHHFND